MQPYKVCHCLTDAFGTELVLENGGSKGERYRILAEMEIDEQPYAVLQMHGDPREDAYLFRVLRHEEDGYVVEDVADDDEWERAADAYYRMICQ